MISRNSTAEVIAKLSNYQIAKLSFVVKELQNLHATYNVASFFSFMSSENKAIIEDSGV